MVPNVTLNPLSSTSKLVDAGYFQVFDSKETRIYDARTTKIVCSKPPVLKGWRDTLSTLWRLPLVKQAPAPNIGQLTSRTPRTRPANWTAQNCHSPIVPVPSKTIANVYQLRTKPEVIRYLHAAAGFPTESTWSAAVKSGNYASWPWLNPETVHKHFPESEETLKGHSQNIRQGYCSTTKPAKRRQKVGTANVSITA